MQGWGHCTESGGSGVGGRRGTLAQFNFHGTVWVEHRRYGWNAAHARGSSGGLGWGLAERCLGL
eukprot:8151347-Alexandrium_andersonii.AAC.1